MGLCDMSGNAAEWTRDTWSYFAHRSLPTQDPVLLKPGNRRVIRGGGAREFPKAMYARFGYPPNEAGVGFRCVK